MSAGTWSVQVSRLRPEQNSLAQPNSDRSVARPQWIENLSLYEGAHSRSINAEAGKNSVMCRWK
jgi:hypothetical protein